HRVHSGVFLQYLAGPFSRSHLRARRARSQMRAAKGTRDIMAATDQTYRNQWILDIVFGASCVLMLVSTIVMFVQDYNREFKHEQRLFRDVETALADRDALTKMPDAAKISAAQTAVDEAKNNLDKSSLGAVESRLRGLKSSMVKAETDYQSKKADFDSKMSFYNIAVEQHGADHPESQKLKTEVDKLQAEMIEQLKVYEQNKSDYEAALREEADLKKNLTKALDDLKKLNSDFDRVAKQAAQKRWRWWRDGFLSLPVIDGFASPLKINQITLEDLPIDYSFKYVTRFDRCMTCHQAIDRPAYTKEALKALTDVPEEQQAKLDAARDLIKQRQATLQGTGAQLEYDPSDLRLPTVKFGNNPEEAHARISEFAAHPRLDLFVSDNSPHPKEKFGCTI